MYIIKYAWLNLKSSFWKNLLTGIIVTAIALAACVSLSIREAADKTREAELQNLSVTANIRVDRNYAMQQMSSGGMDREAANEILSDLRGLTLEEYLVYAEAEAVTDFYYTETVYLNGNDDLVPIGDQEEDTQETTTNMTGPGGMGGPGGMSGPGGMMGPESSMQKLGEFTVIGYSSEAAMEDFQDGIKKIQSGKVFEEGTKKYHCLISENLALYNSLSVGDEIVLTRPDDEEVTLTLTVVGTYSTQTDADYNTTQEDPDNEILISTALMDKIIPQLNENVDVEEEADKIMETVVSGSYCFASANQYYDFEKQAAKLGLEEKYTIVSNDIATYEASLQPLENLKNYAMILLAIVLGVGAVVLVFLNAINVHNRKREIGTLTALGMSRFKVALQYITEILVVMVLFVSIGTVLGAYLSVPVTNELLSSQVELQEAQQAATNQNFGRMEQQQTSGVKPMGGDVEGEVEYISEISYATDYIVILQLIGIMVGLALISSLTSILFLVYMKPVKILTSGD